MKVQIDKFWIEGVLEDAFSSFERDKGADLDRNGKIEGSEALQDFDNDGRIGSRGDYLEYLKQNRELLSERVPFFKWGRGLSPSNRIHQLLYLESDIHPKLIQSAYTFLADLVDETNRTIRNDGDKWTSAGESELYYNTMERLGVFFRAQKEDASFVSNINRRRMDCDTSSFAAMAVGDERGVHLQPARAPLHVFLGGETLFGIKFNIDYGKVSFTNGDYYDNFKITPELAERGDYLRPISDEEIEALFLFIRGDLLLRFDHKEEALKALDRATELYPSYAEAHAKRGFALLKFGRNEEALAAFDRAKDLYPDFAEAHAGRGIALVKLGRNEEALAAFDRSKDLDPDSVDVHIDRGLVLEKLDRDVEALNTIDHAIELYPSGAEAYKNRRIILSKILRDEMDLNIYDREIGAAPNNAEAHFKRGNVLAKLDRKAEAWAAYYRAMELNPDLADAYNNCQTVLKNLIKDSLPFVW